MDLHLNLENTQDFIKQAKFEIFRNRIFVFTPKGDVYDLPSGSTTIDFAYAVHTEIGSHCIGSMINDKMAPLDTELKSGDMVEIIIDKNRKGPSRDWLKFAKTSRAKNKIKALSKESRFEQIRRYIPGIKK
ncbi:MAG: (P)ppGpp synthetase I, SpoT/RelA [Candidatus Falkowbacteria bacterium GW2011_GWF2_39_8]|uniref:(P)ppGpp synthetase I, SpoT/RelA n=1 Tax=Candidatus Falkowbacteria bacterium GW2011_GWF2_39_8 TaxID=1618642 RepID=A0A0G0PYX8_9BACT|nr:MAG: (P)ppGpp synthetase I, SpoT/RelA [Candidatus Falkowbacteria bacterium GW2011_GWF2_39_8]